MSTIVLARTRGMAGIDCRKMAFEIELTLRAQTQTWSLDEALQRLSAGRLSPIFLIVIHHPKAEFLKREPVIHDANLKPVAGLSRWTKCADLWEFQVYFSLGTLSYKYLDRGFLFQEIRRLLSLILATSFNVLVTDVDLEAFTTCDLKPEFFEK